MGGWLFLTIIMDRLRNFPAFIPFSLLMGIISRDILKVFLKPMWIFSREYMARRKRRMERQKLIKMRRKSVYDSQEESDSDDDDGGGREKNQKQAMFSYSEAVEYEDLTGLESYDVSTPRSM